MIVLLACALAASIVFTCVGALAYGSLLDSPARAIVDAQLALALSAIMSPATLASGLIWLPAMLLARGIGEDAKVFVTMLSPLSLLMLHVFYGLMVVGRFGVVTAIDWQFVAFFSPGVMAFTAFFFYFDRIWSRRRRAR